MLQRRKSVIVNTNRTMLYIFIVVYNFKGGWLPYKRMFKVKIACAESHVLK